MTNQPYEALMTIDVDVQNDFAPNRMYPVGKLAVPDGEAVVPVLNQVNAWTRTKGGKVIFTGDWHRKGSEHFKAQGGPWDEHCMQHTAGAAFHEHLEILPGDTIAYKGMSMKDDGYSGWMAQMQPNSPMYRSGDGRYEPEIRTVDQAARWMGEVYHKPHKQLAVVIGGLATDYCVKATALDALKCANEVRERYDARIGIFVVRDAVRAVDVNPGEGDRALEEMTTAGAQIITSSELLSGEAVRMAT